MANIADRIAPKSVNDKTTEMAFVVGAIFVATLLAPICFLGWSLIKAIFIG